MSSKNPTKEKAPATSHSQGDTITVSESQRPPVHSTRSKGKGVARHTQAESSSIAQISIPSGSRTVDEGTPAARHPAVEDANDQLRSEGIRRLSNQTDSPSPGDWAAAQREIAALRSANQELRRQSVAPEQGGHRKQGRRYAAPIRNQPRKRPNSQNQQRRNTDFNSRDRHTDAGIPIGSPRFHQMGPPLGTPSDDNSSHSDRSDYASDTQRRSSRLSRKVNDPDKLDDGTDPTFKQWSDLMEGKLYRNRDHLG